LRGVAKTNAVT